MFCSLPLVNAGPDLDIRNLNRNALVNASQSNYSFAALFAKILRILFSIEINANCRFCMVIWF